MIVLTAPPVCALDYASLACFLGCVRPSSLNESRFIYTASAVHAIKIFDFVVKRTQFVKPVLHSLDTHSVAQKIKPV